MEASCPSARGGVHPPPRHQRTPKWDTIEHYAPNSVQKGDKAQNPVEAAQLLPHSGRREGTRTAVHCPSDTHNQGTETATKVVRQARLELSGGSTPDRLRPPGAHVLLHVWCFTQRPFGPQWAVGSAPRVQGRWCTWAHGSLASHPRFHCWPEGGFDGSVRQVAGIRQPQKPKRRAAVGGCADGWTAFCRQGEEAVAGVSFCLQEMALLEAPIQIRSNHSTRLFAR